MNSTDLPSTRMIENCLFGIRTKPLCCNFFNLILLYVCFRDLMGEKYMTDFAKNPSIPKVCMTLV